MTSEINDSAKVQFYEPQEIEIKLDRGSASSFID